MIRKIEIDDENLNTVDFIDESGNWYCISHSGTDIYDVEEMVKEGRKYEGNVIILVNFEKDIQLTPFEKKENVYIGKPLWYEDAFAVLAVDFNAGEIYIYSISPKDGKKEILAKIPLEGVSSCYNMRLEKSPLTLLRGEYGDDDDIIDVLWPEKLKFKTSGTWSMECRDGDLFYFSTWYEDPDYRDEIIIKDIWGNDVEIIDGFMYDLRDGTKCLMIQKNKKDKKA